MGAPSGSRRSSSAPSAAPCRRPGRRISPSRTRPASRFYYAQRSEVGPQVDRSPRDATGTPTGFDLDVSGLSPTLIAAGAPAVAAPWQLAGASGTDRIVAALAPEEAAASGSGVRARPRTARPQAARPAPGQRLHRLRAGWLVVLLLAHAARRDRLAPAERTDAQGHRDRLVRPPVGRLRLGRRRRLGLVRDQPRRRHRHHPVDRPRCAGAAHPAVRDPRSADGRSSSTCMSPRSPRPTRASGSRRASGPGRARGPASTTRAAGPSSSARTRSSCCRRRWQTRSSTRAPRPASCTGKAPSTVTGTRGGSPISGKAYVEITRYDVPGG